MKQKNRFPWLFLIGVIVTLVFFVMLNRILKPLDISFVLELIIYLIGTVLAIIILVNSVGPIIGLSAKVSGFKVIAKSSKKHIYIADENGKLIKQPKENKNQKYKRLFYVYPDFSEKDFKKFSKFFTVRILFTILISLVALAIIPIFRNYVFINRIICVIFLLIAYFNLLEAVATMYQSHFNNILPAKKSPAFQKSLYQLYYNNKTAFKHNLYTDWFEDNPHIMEYQKEDIHSNKLAVHFIIDQYQYYVEQYENDKATEIINYLFDNRHILTSPLDRDVIFIAFVNAIIVEGDLYKALDIYKIIKEDKKLYPLYIAKGYKEFPLRIAELTETLVFKKDLVAAKILVEKLRMEIPRSTLTPFEHGYMNMLIYRIVDFAKNEKQNLEQDEKLHKEVIIDVRNDRQEVLQSMENIEQGFNKTNNE